MKQRIIHNAYDNLPTPHKLVQLPCGYFFIASDFYMGRHNVGLPNGAFRKQGDIS